MIFCETLFAKALPNVHVIMPEVFMTEMILMHYRRLYKTISKVRFILTILCNNPIPTQIGDKTAVSDKLILQIQKGVSQ